MVSEERERDIYFLLVRTLTPSGSDGKEYACNAGDLGLIPGSERSPGEGKVTYSSILAWRTHGQRSLVGYRPWGHKESNMT